MFKTFTSGTGTKSTAKSVLTESFYLNTSLNGAHDKDV